MSFTSTQPGLFDSITGLDGAFGGSFMTVLRDDVRWSPHTDGDLSLLS